jgi:hypothetical protein
MSKNQVSVSGAVVWLCLLVAAIPAAAGTIVLSPPTEAAVFDPFRLPDGPYGAGNRGIEYDTSDGDLVLAAGAGNVAFAGQVSRSLFVSIDHPGGLRTTYGFVGRILVRKGASVSRGDVVAVAEGPFHFTARLQGDYLDPALLFGSLESRVRLIPHNQRDPAPTAGLWNLAGTLPDGSFGPRTMPYRDRRNHWVRATPGRFGVPHEHETGKERNHGSYLHEAVAGSRRPLRAPDPPLESEDEAVHPR